ncbi:DsrE family protein [Aureliella helgolandensis]|uniref:DsrE/DsrF-like family protein n=1 Tax=Aureliella helgolandensis TaxID=2527968 RepID=A0A518G7T9_9BACT|nr:DsrE family protein [Aureliella helgolandensis]QDV24649.1 DsrE/DsrF-like family protein [Aureliella helgolandensis]
MRFYAPLLALVLLLSFAQPNVRAEDATSTEKTQQVVVHLSHFTDDLHRCFMALKVASLLQEHGAEVTIFLDLEGVRLAERRQLLDLTWGQDSPPLSEHYDKFIDAGGKLVLCPHCAKSARIGSGALKRHAAIATMPSLAKLLLDADKVMDY